MHRFHVPDLGTDNHLWLEGPEAEHLSRVLRIRVGQQVAVFDGSGTECVAVVERVERHRAKLAILSRQAVDRDPRLAVTLAVSIVKAKAMDLLVEKCAELGVREIVPIETSRSVPKVAQREAAHVARWERAALEASKQCRRNTVTRIAPPRPLDSLEAQVRQLTAQLHEALRAAHPEPGSLLYLIGPEGGFELAETDKIRRAGFHLVRLGKSTLRTETAATAALAAILYHYEK